MLAGELEGAPDGIQVRAAGLLVAGHTTMLTGGRQGAGGLTGRERGRQFLIARTGPALPHWRWGAAMMSTPDDFPRRIMTAARDLADRFHERWLAENPFSASTYGIPGYDDLMPDESEEGARAWRAEVEGFLTEAGAIDPEPLTPADAVTLDCTREMANQELTTIDMARAEYTVTAMQYAGPAVLMAVAARTVLLDAAAAEAYLTRLRRSGVWLDQTSERLVAGARKGRLPVAPLVEQAIAWAEAVLADPVPEPILAPQPPPGWAGAAAWEDERRRIGVQVVKPALATWVATVRELLPRARPSEQPGLVYLPGGADDYARAVRAYTTLPLSPEQLHQTGLDPIAALEAGAVELGV